MFAVFRKAIVLAALVVSSWQPSGAAGQEMRYLDQGAAWTEQARAQFYHQDQGSELIPLAWLQALRSQDGRPFLHHSLSRYGYLPDAASAPLPVGFTNAASVQGTMVGMTCAACHVRDITIDRATYRIDGAPAFADFGSFVADLDAAVRGSLASDSAFKSFTDTVIGSAAEPLARNILHAEVSLWSVRFHTLVSRSLPTQRPWGPTRLDAIAVIYNILGGLDVGPPPTYLIPENVQRGDAPTRYPVLWDAARQDFTQWTGVAENGNAKLALARSLSEIYGVFGRFHPHVSAAPAGGLDHDYLADNSTDFAGLGALEGLIDHIGPPAWPGPIDHILAKRGEAIFARPTTEGGCVECHGMTKGMARLPVTNTWKTPLVDVGTDTAAWRILLRSSKTGSLEGAAIPGLAAPLRPTDLSLNLLKTSVLGTIAERTPVGSQSATSAGQMIGAVKAPAAETRSPRTNVYEARVLHGAWAAAPYLHNGSVPTLADLLEPAAKRPQVFEIGPAYDLARVGLAKNQAPNTFKLHVTGCSDRASGDSNCGHEYGTRLPSDEKKALLEYMKTL